MANDDVLGWSLPEPLGMRMDSVKGPGFGMVIATEDESYFVRWCCRNKCGGVYSLTRNRWTLTTPVDFTDFLELLKADGIISAEPSDSWDMRRWIKACMLSSGE